ncbi:hypothetical protein ElyMa_001285400 [Elysia marginata]|uniref:FHA domain-containing protein n=1 Tax=Elysia marginata TaxID=1093978 RepID=A0AAV4IH13_9GAST|nr:hypothetical protein ElyMa_001285400 [Elysia marginata]
MTPRYRTDSMTFTPDFPCDGEQPFVIAEDDVRRSLGRFRDKAAGPDEIKPKLVVKIGKNVTSPVVLNTANPLSTKLHSIFTHDCKAKIPGSTNVKFADDTTVTG